MRVYRKLTINIKYKYSEYIKFSMPKYRLVSTLHKLKKQKFTSFAKYYNKQVLHLLCIIYFLTLYEIVFVSGNLNSPQVPKHSPSTHIFLPNGVLPN